MRAVLTVAVLTMVSLAGCFGNTDETGNVPVATTGSITGNVTDPDGTIWGAFVVIDLDGASTTTGPFGTYRFENVTAGSHSVTVHHNETERKKANLVTVVAGKTTTVNFVLDAAAGPEEPNPQRPTDEFLCDGTTVREPDLTFGRDDGFHGMTWAALKTGFRFGVAIPEVDGAVLTYQVDGASTRSLDLSNQANPFFVFDPISSSDVTGQRIICFSVAVNGEQSPLHAAKLGNGPTSWDERYQEYSLNIFIYSAEGVERDILEAGVPVYTQTLYDATDGYMRAGVVFIVYGDAVGAVETLDPCSTPAISFNSPAGCGNLFDIYFTYQENPLAAGSTPKNGLEEPFQTIRMNQLYEAGPIVPSDANEIGKVFTHELGHYAQGFDDLYASLAGGPDCYVEQTSISVMGSNRDATEYDDENNQCPNIDIIEADGQVYVPTWTVWQKWYTEIPDRAFINPGPEGDGDFMGATIIDWS